MSKKSTTNFETSLQQLEEIVSSMEQDSIPLEELLKQYEQGSTLIKQCEASLTEAKKQLDTIRKKAKTPAATPKKSDDIADDEISLF